MRSRKQGRIPEADPLHIGASMNLGSPRGGGRRLGTLVALGAMTVTAVAGASPAYAFDVGSATLTWEIPHEPAPGTGTLSNYATTIGNEGGTGGVTATAPATGNPITSTSTPTSAAGAKYPFLFPATTSGAIGTYDAATKVGSIKLAGTVTFRAHSDTWFSVVNPRLSFDGPGSIRVVATGLVAAGSQGGPAVPPAAYDSATTPGAGTTVFALNETGATTTTAANGSITISNLIPSGTPVSSPTSYLSSNTVFDSIRPWFVLARPNQRFSVTFAPVGVTPTAQCSDGVDNDADSKIDFGTGATNDPGCTSATDTDEADAPPTTGGASQTLPVSGTVGANTMSLTLGQASADLGTFLPGVAADYATTIPATVTSTGPATLSVVDPGANAGFLTNGTAKLASALQARAGNTATPAGTYSTISGTPATLLSYASSVNSDAVTIGLKQAISATEPLTSGTYGKTLTFTVAATTP